MSSPVRIPDGFVEELKARIRPSDVIGRKVKLKKQGKEWVGLSPFTSEKSPSFYVNDQKRIFKDFSSGLGGDVISFVMETERLSFMEAVEKLAEEAGMELPKATPQDEEAYDRRKRLYECCEAACAFYEDRLRAAEGSEARTYLEGRGLGAGAWARHRLGFAPDDWRTTLEHLKSRGFTMKEIMEAGLAVQKEGGGGDPYDRFRGRVIFPITDTRGAVIAFGGRGLQPDAKPKYLNSSDTDLFHKGRVLYRYKDAREAFGSTDEGGLIVCEGYMDAIALAEAGFGHAVAPLGTALTEDQLGLLWRAGPEPVLCFDGDAAGLRAADRSIERALPHLEPGRSLFFCLLGGGMDPDDLIRQSGADAMRAALEHSLPLVEVLWRRERDAEAIDTPERQAGLEARLMQAAGQIRNPSVRSAYERDLKSRMRDHLWAQRKAKRGTDGQGRRGEPASKGAQQTGTPAKTRGLGLLVRAVDNPHLVDIALETLGMASFPDPDVAAIRDLLISGPETDKGVDRSVIRDHLRQRGKTRAADLLESYPEIPEIAPDGPEEREWLIALEQYVAREDAGPFGVAGAGDEVTSSPESWRRLHHEVSERKARAARLNEAAEQVDRD